MKKYLFKIKYFGYLIKSCSTSSHHDLKDFVCRRLLAKGYIQSLISNLAIRKGADNSDHIMKLHESLYNKDISSFEVKEIQNKLIEEYLKMPNTSHPDAPVGDETKSNIIEYLKEKIAFTFKPKSVIELGEKHKCLQIRDVGKGTGARSYYLTKQFADLETALVNYTLDVLQEKGFMTISVPDILHTTDIESAGFKTTGERTQVYKLRETNVGLSGTGEMAIAAYLKEKTFDCSKLPLRLATVSRCFRAETSDIERERGLYRVHNFTKVEMFGVTADQEGVESENMLKEFVNIQKELFANLNLHVRIVDMATQELGLSAHRKFDIETWLPAKQFWGEISSASNCTDYQSMRLSIRYNTNSILKYCHTINGTACAIPRILIALVENNQQKDLSIKIPEVLLKYLDFKTIGRTKNITHL